MIRLLRHNPLVQFLLLYVLLIIPWPGFTQAYATCFQAVTGAIFSRYSEAIEVTFETPEENNLPRHCDTRIVIVKPALMHADGSGPIRNLDLGSGTFGWRPMAMLLALIIATPLPWRRRRRALLFGTLCLHGFIVLTLGVWIWTESAALSQVNPSPFWNAAAIGVQTLGTQLSFAIPVLIWFLVTFQSDDKIGSFALFAFGPLRQRRCFEGTARAHETPPTR